MTNLVKLVRDLRTTKEHGHIKSIDQNKIIMVWILMIFSILLIVGASLGLLYYYPKSDKDNKARINKLHDENYDPNMTIPAAKLSVKSSVARTEAAVQVANESSAVINLITQESDVAIADHHLEHIHEELTRYEETKVATHKLNMDNVNLQKMLISNAQSDGMDVTTYLEVLRTRALNKAEIEKIMAKAQAELKAGFIFQLQEYQKLTMLREVLNDLYEQHYLVETTETREPIKLRKLAQIDKDIILHEKDADGRRQRLLQAFDGEEVQRSDEDTDDSGDT